MFEMLTDRVGKSLRNLSGRGRISESNVREAMDGVRTALLEADVHHEVVDSFCEEVVTEALGREVTKSLKPGEEMIGVVHDKLVELMGPDPSPPMWVEPGPTIVMLCGLQGSGKTTTCGKLAARWKNEGRKVLVAAADLQRPAAVEQLQTVVQGVESTGRGSGQVAFHGEPERCAEFGRAVGEAVTVCRNAINRARDEGHDVVLLDTAGRLHVDDELMGELEAIRTAVRPHRILLVVDAMSGQDAVDSARAFHQRLEVDGVILSKFDSDARGGAALSVRRVTGAPIVHLGVGEHSDQLEDFHAERVAGRILGMGDVVSLVEKARDEVDEAEAQKMAVKLAEGRMTMDDFLSQIKAIRRMGPIKQLLGMLPGMGAALKDMPIDEKQFDRVEAIIGSMTKSERSEPDRIERSRAKRIAAGSGTARDEVSRLMKQFDGMSQMAKSMLGPDGTPREQPAIPGLPGVGKGNTQIKSRRAGAKRGKGKKRR